MKKKPLLMIALSFMSGKRKKEGDNFVEWMKTSNFTMK